jgi:hypothetical protein
MNGFAYSSLAIVSRPKIGALIRHHGIRLPSGMVAHCSPIRGEHISTEREFSAGQVVSSMEIPQPLHSSVIRNINVAMLSPRPYHLTQNNCETFVNRMTSHSVGSPTVAGLVALGLVALIVRLAVQ